MTDGELIKIMERIDRLTSAAVQLANDKLPEHPNGEALLDELHENGFGYTWAIGLITHPHLNRPERWEVVRGKLKYRKPIVD